MTIRELDQMTDDNTLELVWDDDLNATALTGVESETDAGLVDAGRERQFGLAAGTRAEET